VSAIILDVSPAMAALLDRYPDSMKSLDRPLGEIEKTIVAWIESPRNWESELEVHSDPMPERKPAFLKRICQLEVPFGQVVEKEGTAVFENSSALFDPLIAPLQVFPLCQSVIDRPSIVFSNVERRIREYSIDATVPQ
jgi:hypothetical protein